MRVAPFPLFLSLLVAIATGVTPLRECRPNDGCAGGVVAAGLHAHGHHHDHGRGCDHGHDPRPNGNRDADPEQGPAEGCCEEAPFHTGLRTTAVALEAPAPATAALPVEGLLASLDAGRLLPTPDRTAADVPRGIESVVLLR